jgi:DNA-directed RNA polymerase sigma subunit (sigma70/sigma32)
MEQVRDDREEKVARWRRLLDDGVYPSRAELARAEGVSRAAVTQALRRSR